MNDLAGFEISAQDFVKAFRKHIDQMKPVFLEARGEPSHNRSAASAPDPQPAEALARASRKTKTQDEPKSAQGSLW